MGDNIRAESGRDTNFAKDRGVVVNISQDLGALLSVLKEDNVAPEHLDRLREALDEVFRLQGLLLDLQEEIFSLRKENKELKDTLEIKAKMKFEKPFYFVTEGKQKDGPFCPKCLDDEGKQIRVTDYGDGSWQCPKCQSTFFLPGFDI